MSETTIASSLIEQHRPVEIAPGHYVCSCGWDSGVTRAELQAEIERLRSALQEAEQWVSKLAADAPEGMVGKGAIIQRSLKRIRGALRVSNTDERAGA